MKQALSRLFNIHPHEWPRFSWLYLMSLILVIGRLWGKITLNAVFLDVVGADKLPVFFTLNAILSIPAVAVYTAFADRIRNDRLLIGIHLVSAIALGSGLLLLQLGYERVAYTLMYVVVFVPLGQILGAHWYTYINGFYDTRTAKRLLPMLVTSFGIAAIISGLTVKGLNTIFTPSQVMFIWFGMMVITVLMILLLPRFLPETPTLGTVSGETAVPAPPHTSYPDNMREGYRYVMDSGLLRWMVVGTLIISLLVTFLEYLTGQVLESQLGTTQNIAGFLGQLAAFANLIIVLPMQLFVLNRLIARIGLGTANFIFPIGNLLVSLGFILSPNLMMARLAQINITDFRYSIGYPIENLLYNAVPLRVKGRVRAFISGVVTPLGTLLAGVLLFLCASLPSSTLATIVRASVGTLAIVYVIVGWIIRRQYQQALIRMLEQEDYSFLLNQEASDLTLVDPTALTSLTAKLAASDNPEFTIFLVRLISEIGGQTAVSILEQTARASTAAVRATVVDILVATGANGATIRLLYTDFLQDPDARVRRAALTGLERLDGAGSRSFQTLAAQMLVDPDVEIRARVLSVLLRADEASRAQALPVLTRMLNEADVPSQIWGIRATAAVGDAFAVQHLLPYVAAAADEVRLETAVALEALVIQTAASQKIPPHLAPDIVRYMVARVHDPVQRIRQSALTIIATLGTPASYAVLVEAFADSSQLVRETAVDALVRLGKVAIPIVHPQLDAPSPQQRKLAAIVLSRVNAREFGALIKTHIMSNLLVIYQQDRYLSTLEPLTNFAGISVLCSALQEENVRLLNEIFYLLKAVYPAADIDIIQEALQSDNERVQANAIEAVEGLTSPQTASLMAPLFNPEDSQRERLRLSHEIWEMEPLQTHQAVESLVTDAVVDAWLRTIATYALGEIGATMIPGASSQPAPSPRRAPPGLMATLNDEAMPPTVETPASGDTPQADPPVMDERQRRERRRHRAAALLDALSTDSPFPQTPQKEEVPHEQEPPATPSTASMETLYVLPPAVSRQFRLPDVIRLLQMARQDSDERVRSAAIHAQAAIIGGKPAPTDGKEGILLSVLERIIFLKEVLFFHGMTVDQLKVLASVCEERFFPADTAIYREGDPGHVLYVVVNGRVAIERAGQRKGSVTRLNTITANAYFGEMDLFTDSPRSASAIAIQDTLTLSLHRDPLIALMRQQPDLSLELINVLSVRLSEATDQIAQLTRSTPRELHKLFDQLDS